MRYYAIGTNEKGQELLGTDHFLKMDARLSLSSAVELADKVLHYGHGLMGYNLYRGENVRTMKEITMVRFTK